MKKFIIIIVLFLGTLFLTIGFSKEVYAAEEIELSIDSVELYNATNTYPYIQNYLPNEARYNLTKKDETKKVSTDAPLLTVFTHGLGGEASHWSNNGGDFAYSEDSLITRLAKMVNSNVYWLKFKKGSSSNFDILNITDTLYNCIDNQTSSEFPKDAIIEYITDISKHIIIIFEAGDNETNGKNDVVYTQFNYAISKIVYDISQLNNGVLPTMNLIGHSRGGITNMQYALDHPDLVHSIYSFGTP